MVRLMRGGTQAHLIQTNDLGFYVVKFISNPQHRRILTNEMLSSLLLIHLGLPTPPVALVSLDARFLLACAGPAYDAEALGAARASRVLLSIRRAYPA